MICLIELKISGSVILSKFCILSIERFHPVHFCQSYALKSILVYAGFSSSDLTGHHFMICAFNYLNISILKTVSYLSAFEICKNYMF